MLQNDELKRIAEWWQGHPPMALIEQHNIVWLEWWIDASGRGVLFDPFLDLNHAFALQAQVERRGWTAQFETNLWTVLFEDCVPGDKIHRGVNWGLINASADQRTRAVLYLIEQEAANG